MKSIAVIFGSANSEHDVSITSAVSLMQHFPHELFTCVPIYLGKDGAWYTGDYDYDALLSFDFETGDRIDISLNPKTPGFINAATGAHIAIHGAINMLHGPLGEGGYVQGLLETAGIPYTGSDVLSSALCMDKAYTHMICERYGIEMTKFQLLTPQSIFDAASFSYPLIVKPSREGSSFGVHYVEAPSELQAALDDAFTYDSRVLVEDFVEGIECGVAVYQTKDTLLISDMDQVNKISAVFDYEEKYRPSGTETLPVAEFSENTREKARQASAVIFKALGCRHMSRLDFFVTPDLRIVFNEINTIPGFTKTSRYPSMLARAGLSYEALILGLIEDIVL